MEAAAARMDAMYRGQRHIYDFTRRYYLLGRDGLIRALAPPPGGTVLEMGCGTARNLIAVARIWPGTPCFGVDISTEMLTTALTSLERAGLAEDVSLAQGDATAFDPQRLFGRRAFDRVFLSYTLSMIPDWRGAIAQAARIVAPGGALHIVDFGQQEGLPRWFRAGLFAWLARFDVTPRAELESALAQIAAREGMHLVFRPSLRGYAWSATLSR